MKQRTAKLTLLSASIALLAACGGGGGGGGDPSPDTAPDTAGPGTGSPGTTPDTTPGTGTDPDPTLNRGAEISALEAGYEVAGDLTRIRAQLDPATLERVSWGDGAAPVPNANPRNYDTKTSWTWQLLDDVNTGYDANVYVLDMFAQLDGQIQAKLEGLGRDTICYFSVGTYEPWRPDRGFFTQDMLGQAHVGYADERWLDVTDERVLRIMVNRMDMAKTVGCDGVELDNVDGYENVTGWENGKSVAERQADTIEFTRILANEAHERGMSVALKNGPAILPDVIDWFDLSINESCHHFDECGPYDAMIDAGKPVFNAEYAVWENTTTPIPVTDPRYDDALRALCADSVEQDLRTLLLPKSLDGSSRLSCDDVR